jgi:hypothetical protein
MGVDPKNIPWKPKGMKGLKIPTNKWTNEKRKHVHALTMTTTTCNFFANTPS